MNLNAAKRYDLHTHTRASDGMNAPADNVKLAKENGLSGLAITDHDTVAGVEEARETGEMLGVTVVPGIEISTRAKGKDIHVLGYFINYKDEQLLMRLVRLRALREERNERIIFNLRQLGIPISLKEVEDGLGGALRRNESLGRPHIADTLVRKGYAADMRDAFDRYLGEGKPGYASVPRIAPEEAIKWILDAGGVPVLAHPGLYGSDELVREILERGKPAGIEVFHSDHCREQEERYLTIAKQYGLIPTGGSDFHGLRQGVVFHGNIGSRFVYQETIQQLSRLSRINLL